MSPVEAAVKSVVPSVSFQSRPEATSASKKKMSLARGAGVVGNAAPEPTRGECPTSPLIAWKLAWVAMSARATEADIRAGEVVINVRVGFENNLSVVVVGRRNRSRAPIDKAL